MNLNKQNWKDFKIKDIFIYSRGARLITSDQVEWDIAYISSTKKNNWIDNYITPPNFMKIYNNALTINNSWSVWYCFYHSYDFVASDHCTILEIKDKNIKLNNYISLFLKPVLESIKPKCNFAREISNKRLEKEYIKLPFKWDKPDWEFMEDYIKNLSSKIKYSWNVIKNIKRNIFNLDNWKEFFIWNLFEIEKWKDLASENISWLYPLISATKENNWITWFYNNPNRVFPANTITVASNGSVWESFFQEIEYCATWDINILIPRFNINIYSAIFIITLFKIERHKFSYWRKWWKDRMEKTIIKLPVNKESKPDFQFMEDYIKTLNYSKYL